MIKKIEKYKDKINKLKQITTKIKFASTTEE